MKKEIIGFIICIMLVGTVLTVTGNVIIASSNDNIKLNYDINHPRNPNFSYSYEETGILDVSDIPKSYGGPDIGIFRFLSWWSPAPWNEGVSYLCYSHTLVNFGDTYEGNGTIDGYIYLIYSDKEILLEHSRFSLPIWKRGYFIYTRTTGGYNDSDKPLMIRMELHPSFPDSNLRNNMKTVPLIMGVTIDGMVYKKDLNGNRQPIEDARITCNSDILLAPLLKTTYDLSETDGYYCLWSPKNPNFPSFKYTIQAILLKGLHGYTRIQTEKTAPLNGYKYGSVDFEFFIIKSKSINSRSNQCVSMFQRIIDMFPILQRILNSIL